MNPVSTSLDSLQGFVRQFGIADSGDALAVLRSLGLSINEAMAGAIGTQNTDLEDRIQRLAHSRELLERVAAGRPMGGFVAWPVDEANALRSAFTPPDDPFGPFETFIQYQREVIAADGSRTSETGSTIASQANWLSDYTRSVNQLGQVVWTQVGGGDAPETIVFTELETLQGVPEARVQALEVRLVLELGSAVQALVAGSTQLRYTLVEWLGEVRVDERWQKFGRANEERRSDAQLDTRRQELAALLERLHEIGQEAVGQPPSYPPAGAVLRAVPPPPAADEAPPPRGEPVHRATPRP